MEFGPILSAMRRNKVGAIMIVVQTAITLAIMCATSLSKPANHATATTC